LLRDQLGFDRHLVLTDDLSHDAFRSQFPLDQALPAALAAGNDLAIVARDSTELEQAAACLAKTPAPQRQDAEIRIERFRKKLAFPPPWSEDRWKTTAGKLLKA
jgi:beta-glucosidase-like glycosyl hydrolase